MKSTGFYYKAMLRENIKDKLSPQNECFREGESEDYDSEDADDIDFDTPVVNFDIVGVKDEAHAFHKTVMNLVAKHTEDFEELNESLTHKFYLRQKQREVDE